MSSVDVGIKYSIESGSHFSGHDRQMACRARGCHPAAGSRHINATNPMRGLVCSRHWTGCRPQYRTSVSHTVPFDSFTLPNSVLSVAGARQERRRRRRGPTRKALQPHWGETTTDAAHRGGTMTETITELLDEKPRDEGAARAGAAVAACREPVKDGLAPRLKSGWPRRTRVFAARRARRPLRHSGRWSGWRSRGRLRTSGSGRSCRPPPSRPRSPRPWPG